MTTLGGGLGGGVMVAKETTYGTWVTPTRSLEVRDAKMQYRRQNPQQGTGLAYGRSIDLGSRRVTPWYDAGGTVDMEVLTTGQALMLSNAMGCTGTLTQNGTTTAYTLTANYGVPDSGFTPSVSSFSMQALVPDTGGNIKQQNFHGCKITKATWSCDRTGLLMASYDIDSQTWDNTNTAQVPAYTTTTQAFSGANMTFAAGTFGSESALDGVRSVTVTLERMLEVTRIYLGNTSKEEPITNGVTKLSITCDVDLLPGNQSSLWNLYSTQAAIPSLAITWTAGAIGSSGFNNTFKLNPTNVYIDTNGTPQLDGPDIVKATLNFTGLIDAANDSAFIATLTTSDTTL